MAEKEKLYIAFADYEVTITFEFRGILAESLEKAKEAIQREVIETFTIDGKKLAERDCDVFFKDNESVPNYGIRCDAMVVVTQRAGNRKPRTLQKSR